VEDNIGLLVVVPEVMDQEHLIFLLVVDLVDLMLVVVDQISLSAVTVYKVPVVAVVVDNGVRQLLAVMVVLVLFSSYIRLDK
tara:strand:+ start:422 stop:667 length:246 start_codon:yes stop_codon:yes gene_type:complete